MLQEEGNVAAIAMRVTFLSRKFLRSDLIASSTQTELEDDVTGTGGERGGGYEASRGERAD